MGKVKDKSKMGNNIKRDTGDLGRKVVWVFKTVGSLLNVSSLWVKSADGANRQ